MCAVRVPSWEAEEHNYVISPLKLRVREGQVSYHTVKWKMKNISVFYLVSVFY